ncbi:MAG: hypothetical protein ACLFQ6_07245 [Candidatus Sumerlaeia bacterium]
MIRQFSSLLDFQETLLHEIGHHVFRRFLTINQRREWVTKIYPPSAHVNAYAGRNASSLRKVIGAIKGAESAWVMAKRRHMKVWYATDESWPDEESRKRTDEWARFCWRNKLLVKA